jgi:hypothetical protein
MTALGSAPAEHEALRHAALRALREEESDAPELARRYAEACARRFALPLPLSGRGARQGARCASSCWVRSVAAWHRDDAGDDFRASARALRGCFRGHRRCLPQPSEGSRIFARVMAIPVNPEPTTRSVSQRSIRMC